MPPDDKSSARDEKLMREAIAEAELARGRTHPNPIVGALVVKAGKVISRGHHEKAGGPHAEIVALQEAGKSARGADLFVTLEPCNHSGRTPPCTEAILAAGIKRVFIGTADPNPHVRGAGAKRLRAAGVEVKIDLLGEECAKLIEQWRKFVTTGVPWIVLKAAITLDGKIATASGDSRWVTGEVARRASHVLRNELDAVLVGVNTVLLDDPQLTVRLTGPGDRVVTPRPLRDPVRVVVDALARTQPVAKMLTQGSAAATLIATTSKALAPRLRALEKAGAEILLCKGDPKGFVDLEDLLGQLGARGLTSMLVEGGSTLHGSFLRKKLWDELQLFVAPKLAGRDSLSWAGLQGPRSMADALEIGALEVDAVSYTPDLLIRSRRTE